MDANYDYKLPKELIAKQPAVPRDASKLLVYDALTDKIRFDFFRNLGRHLPKKSFLVLNKTKVLPARIEVTKETGGKARLLLLLNETPSGARLIACLSDRKLPIGRRLFVGNASLGTVCAQDANKFILKPLLPYSKILSLLKRKGSTPIPPYIKDSPLCESMLRKKYQTIFADSPGSVAAPTSSLHFTRRVFTDLKKRAITSISITLHVGMGTFAPFTPQQLEERTLFEEQYEISPSARGQIQNLKRRGYKLIAAGTTTVRALESAAANASPIKCRSSTDLFITPPYDFRLVDCLVTNFHVPNSSLLRLVEAFLQFKKARRRLVDIYKIAIGKKFRFYSFGDAMLIV